MLLYIAGPYSGIQQDKNIENARSLALKLFKLGHTPICPHLNFIRFERDLPDVTHDEWLKRDFGIIDRCDGVVVVEDWEPSRGTQMEVAYCQENGIPVWFAPDLPELHLTEQRCPVQTKEFAKLLGSIYRIHLSKNRDYCIAPGTKVLDGELNWTPIEDLTPSDLIVGFDEECQSPLKQSRRMYRPSVVERVSTVVLPSYRITLESGKEFVCSAQHPWLVKSGLSARWCLTENLQPSDTHPSSPSQLIKLLDVWEPTHTYESGYLAAAFDGEGWLSQCPPKGVANEHKRGNSLTLGFAQNDNAMFRYVIDELDRRGLSYRVKKNKGGRLNQVIFGKPRRDAIRLIGEIRPKRLIENLNHNLGMIDLREKDKVIHKEFIGDQTLIALGTSTRTFIADGYATHNSPANILGLGEVGLSARLWDKVARLLNLIGWRLDVQMGSYERPLAPKHEAIEDTYQDLACYALIGILLRDGKWGR